LSDNRARARRNQASGRPARPILLLIGSAGVLVGGYVHYFLYFERGYRNIHPETFVGLTVSRAFILNAAAAVVIAEALVLATRWPRLIVPSALAGIVFAAGTLIAYVLTRTTGFLGFTESLATTEALIAGAAEVIAAASLATVLAGSATAKLWDRATHGSAPPRPASTTSSR
jgi:hypothetical protein